MQHSDPSKFFGEKADRLRASLAEVNSQIKVISNLRLGLAIGFLLALYFATANQAMFVLAAVLLGAFILQVRNHALKFEEKTHLENLLKIQINETRCLAGDSSGFEPGTEFVNPHHPYSHDLDVFGEDSLYQYVNRANTIGGKLRMSERLSKPMPSIKSIEGSQQAVKELSAKPDFCQEIQASGMAIEELPLDKQQLSEWIAHKSFVYGRPVYKVILTVVPAITLALLVLVFFVDGLTPFFWLCVIFQWAFLGFHMKKITQFHQYISRKQNVLKKYSRVLNKIDKETFESPAMTQISATAKNAHSKVDRLASLVNAFDARSNMMTMLFVNSFLLYDLQCVYRLEKWKEENAANFEPWIDALEETEVLCSLGGFAFKHKHFTYPKVNQNDKVNGIAIGHPLIPAEECVTNDVMMDHDKSIIIITGANMAGKSTFLRTLGVNIVLALAGAPVFAKEFECPLLELRSGMRTADSLKDHQSYFYAELNRLKGIVDELKTGKKLFVLLDEILKGTNSTDKQAGSIALVTQLIQYPSIVVIATHDLALGDLEKQFPEKIRNYCFEPTIVADQLNFDYKLNRGIATKMNATFLMKKMGIIPG